MCYNKLALKVAHNLIKLDAEVSYAPVAQPDRVTGYEPVCRGFESLPARDKAGEFSAFLLLFFCFVNKEKII